MSARPDLEHWMNETFRTNVGGEDCYKRVMLFGANPEVEEVLLAQGQAQGLHVFDDDPDYCESLKPLSGDWKTGFNCIVDNTGHHFFVVCGVASNPQARYAAMGRIKRNLSGADNWVWLNVIASSAHVGMHTSLGRGVLVLDMCYVGPGASLKDGVVMLSGSKVCHSSVVGANSILVCGSTVLGRATLLERCWVCGGAVVLPSATIGPDAQIGAGGVAMRMRT